MSQLVPFSLPPNCCVLLSGAGGGFDFVCGLPVALELETRGHTVHLANYSFSELRSACNAKTHLPGLVEVDAETTGNSDYFPERDIAAWYAHHRASRRPVWCFEKRGLADTLASYQYLVQRLNITAVICVDGGVDGLFRGDETDLGTPSMDTISIFATHLCGAAHRIYASVGFGTEGAEGSVSHAQALRRMAELIADDASLGVGLIQRSSQSGADFIDAVNFVFARMQPVRRSIMVSSLLAAVRGEFGRKVVHPKTAERPPWVSPLTALVWYFNADAVAKAKPYYTEALATKSIDEIADLIEATRSRLGIQRHEAIPI
jgi:hypothetical protein